MSCIWLRMSGDWVSWLALTAGLLPETYLGTRRGNVNKLNEIK